MIAIDAYSAQGQFCLDLLLKESTFYDFSLCTSKQKKGKE